MDLRDTRTQTRTKQQLLRLHARELRGSRGQQRCHGCLQLNAVLHLVVPLTRAQQPLQQRLGRRAQRNKRRVNQNL